jgi:hypothetical protein
MAVSDRTWDRLVELEVGNKDHRLYGGSQYHRTLREFSLATKCLRLPTVAEDEIANAAGIGETHDGVNFLHAACTIALEKARTSFEPLLTQLQRRMIHVMERLYPVTEYMLRENRNTPHASPIGEDGIKIETFEQTMDISQNPQFRQLMRTIFEKFVQQCSASVCQASLRSYPVEPHLTHLFSSLSTGNVEVPRRLGGDHSLRYMEPR